MVFRNTHLEHALDVVLDNIVHTRITILNIHLWQSTMRDVALIMFLYGLYTHTHTKKIEKGFFIGITRHDLYLAILCEDLEVIC